jgi:hypothetical protein
MIPKTVRVGRRKYVVHVGPAKRFPRALGYIDYTPGDIYIHDHKPAQMQETFWHELTHAILHEMDHPLYRSEVFVTQFAKLLSQSINSARF